MTRVCWSTRLKESMQVKVEAEIRHVQSLQNGTPLLTCSSELVHVQRNYDVSVCPHNKITDVKNAYVYGQDTENRRHDMLYSL